MNTKSIRLSPRHQWYLYTVFGVLFVSGVVWAVFHYCIAAAGEFGETRSPFELLALQVHGAAAMGALIVIGSLIPIHMRTGWFARLNFASGCTLIGVNTLLIVSGYLLYYCGNDVLRSYVSVVHLAVGIILAAALFWHVYNRP
jgi:hypothetical protein